MGSSPLTGRESLVSGSAAPNSKAEIEKRVALGQITWTGPLIVVMARSFFMITAQALVAAVYLVRHHPAPWNAAAPWWSVYGTLVDIGCLALMVKFTRGEGIGFRDLLGRVRLRWGADIFLGVGYLLVLLSSFRITSPLVNKLVYGSTQFSMYPGLLTARTLPLWGVIYSLSLFWITWSPTEEMTYNGYSLPRVQALSGRGWVAVVVVGFWWTLQHSFFPLVLDWKYVLWRFFFFLPVVMLLTCINLWTRRLPPLIVAHWPMDFAAAILSLKL
jgi:hypothetical protein